jgi:hypothetical protein
MTGVVIGIATGATLLGFFLGVRSKAVAKRKAIDKERRQVESLTTITNKKCPPPPPPPRVIREGANILPPPPRASKRETNYKHMKPGIYYTKNTFVNTTICKNCKVIGHRMDMGTYRPCPKCGGTVKNHNVSKWDSKTKTWVKTTAR